jgi:peptidoglycan/LPS O-acetylase OafA/YrhL
VAIRDNDRLLTLDVARGVAALSVVVFHWSHFHQANGDIAGALPQNLPLYAVFWPAYHFGTLGVDFFFVLSGAIFFTKYAHAITERRVTGWQFFVLRFSRLYPLHFATLLLVAALQWALVRRIGHAVIYEANDLPHFVVNLLFIQNWGISALTSDSSFNAPSWSLSIEALLYIVFFALFVAFRYVRPSVFYFLALAAIGMWLKSAHAESGIARGL